MEANYFNARIFQRLSVTTTSKDISKVPLLLTSTSPAQLQYGDCLTHFKNRLDLEGDQDLYVLINVTMSPWPTDGDFLGELAKEFKKAAEEEMTATVFWNVEFPHFHGFVIQGTEQICGVHLPMFNMENHRTQLIISCDFPPDIMEKYRQRKAADPKQFFTFGNKKPAKLLDLIKDGASFEATIQEQLPGYKQPISESFTVSNVKILLRRSMHQVDLSPSYPERMVFYAYSRGSELHMDHLLNVSPNIQLNSECLTLVESKSLTSKPAKDQLANGAWLRLTQVEEKAIQPLIMRPTDPHTAFPHPGVPFTPGIRFAFEGFETDNAALKNDSTPTMTGVVELGPSVFADTNMLNADGGAEEHDEEAASFTTAMDAQVNAGGALAAEYPNTGASEELRNQYESSVVQDFTDNLLRSKQAEAQKSLDTGEDEKVVSYGQILAGRLRERRSGSHRQDQVDSNPYVPHGLASLRGGQALSTSNSAMRIS